MTTLSLLFAGALLALGAGCTPEGNARATPRENAPATPASSSPAPAPPSSVPADEAMPPATSDELQTRGRHLLEAIAQDNPQLAQDLLFPRDGFAATRDAADPARAWEKTVHAPFLGSVHRLHRRVRGLAGAQVVSLELGQSVVQVLPHKKEWKRPLWRVRHSRLVIVVEGRSQRIDIPEMTSWRGAWYVTKLR